MEFKPSTTLLEYQDGAYLCDGKYRVEGPLDLDTLAQAIEACPKLQMVSLDDAPFGDPCFPLLAQLPKLNTLSLLRGRQITGHGLELLKDLPLKNLFLQRTALDDEGLAQAARIAKLENLYLAACPQVTFQGLMAVHWRVGLHISDKNKQDAQGMAGLFTEGQWKAFEDARTYQTMKNSLPLSALELAQPIETLRQFFEQMTQWEGEAERKGLQSQGIRQQLEQLFAHLVSRKPRPDWRPVHLSSQAGGTYSNHRLVIAERVTKNQYWLYAENQQFYYRFLLRRIEENWMIDNAQQCNLGRWRFCGL